MHLLVICVGGTHATYFPYPRDIYFPAEQQKHTNCWRAIGTLTNSTKEFGARPGWEADNHPFDASLKMNREIELVSVQCIYICTNEYIEEC